VVGLSDLARDDSGRYWAVEEREPTGSSAVTREIVRLDLGDGTRPRVVERLRFQLPRVLDTESIASLGPGLFAIGTEVHKEHVGEGNQTADEVFVVAVEGGVASIKVGAGWDLSYAPWNLKREVNHGIEGMCATSRRVLMASEQRIGTDPTFAPIQLRDQQASSSLPGKLWLTHDGRISALTCCEAPDGGLDVIAIQRDLRSDGTSIHRLLGFRLPAAGPLDVRPDLDVDLEPLYANAGGVGLMPNLEGLAPLGASSIAIVTDDSPRSDAELLVLTAATGSGS
jgi:hypothetical protein